MSTNFSLPSKFGSEVAVLSFKEGVVEELCSSLELVPGFSSFNLLISLPSNFGSENVDVSIKEGAVGEL